MRALEPGTEGAASLLARPVRTASAEGAPADAVPAMLGGCTLPDAGWAAGIHDTTDSTGGEAAWANPVVESAAGGSA